ncbi:hypothetical protein [Nannocystis pusilla]|uniref:hypothetical protein n=1 Tax=Nannocystis pusilla TaxID=889268 RepID=UPI003B770C27
MCQKTCPLGQLSGIRRSCGGGGYEGTCFKDMFSRAASWRPRPLTLGLAATAIASAALLRFDPWAGGPAAPMIYSAQSAARRVFPELSEPELARATITLTQAGQPPVTLTPADNGQHAVFVGEAPLGPADAEGLAGLWSSLRMATTLRAVAEDSALGPVRGEIAVEVEGRRAAVTLHGAASDGVGDYGTIAGAGAWVVEPELAAALAQPASAWLSRRLVPIEASEAAAVRVGPLELARGADSLWRVVTGLRRRSCRSRRWRCAWIASSRRSSSRRPRRPPSCPFRPGWKYRTDRAGAGRCGWGRRVRGSRGAWWWTAGQGRGAAWRRRSTRRGRSTTPTEGWSSRSWRRTPTGGCWRCRWRRRSVVGCVAWAAAGWSRRTGRCTRSRSRRCSAGGRRCSRRRSSCRRSRWRGSGRRSI